MKLWTKARRRHTAYHEAGHAVIRHRIGCKPPFYRVAIYDRAYDSDNHLHIPNADGGIEVTPVMLYGIGALVADILETLAGPIAEAKLRHISGVVIALTSGTEDYQTASDKIDQLKEIHWPGVRTIERRASKLVTHHWGDIVIVAESLIERGCLMYDEFVELID